ncbi:MAG: F0F1 ATP synthase subunit B [Oscillospiraceae bacterium]|nr:F0F1 ATP synthase subunit B [Oscillospiraceae bacterium]
MFESFIGVNFWTALFVLLNTLAIFFVAKKYLFVPVKNMIDSRQKEIDDMYAEAGSARQEAKELQAEYQQKLSVAQATSERIVKEAVARGLSREDEIIRKANEEAAAIIDKASADIAMEKKKAINDAKNEISDLAMAIAGKVVERELDGKDQQALIDSFINGLGDGV